MAATSNTITPLPPPVQSVGSFPGQEPSSEGQAGQQARSVYVLSRPGLPAGSPQPRLQRMPQCSMGDAQVAQGREKTGQRRAVSTRDELTERPSSSRSRPEGGGWSGSWVYQRCHRLYCCPSVQGNDLPLAPLALASSHMARQETAAVRASPSLWRKQRAAAKAPSPHLPSTAPPWGWGTKLLTRPGVLDHTSLACHLLATCHLCTC